MTFHRHVGKLICHLCGKTQKAPSRCPECGSKEILYAGVGTERVEEAVRTLFPQARLTRMDSDTMRGKGIYEKTLQQFRQQKIDILLGTQMIAKGLDFPNVTLVGIINADTSLHAPDFRAGERTFQLLTQVAGRAGRGDREGEVIIQTYSPQNPSLQFARHHDYLGFFAQEKECRELLHYPPFYRMILFQLRGKEASKVEQAAQQLGSFLQRQLPSNVILGEAVPAPIEKAHGQYRFQISLKTPSRKLIDQPLSFLAQKWIPPKGVILTLDVDPQSLL
jgi:primosomal protein N' (replication factor Y) (superfamily II helicase)